MKRILIKLKKRFKKDQLLGHWHTEDGSGFMIIMGSWIEFRKDGSGSYESWSTGDDETTYNFKGSFNWDRLEQNKISIQEIDSDKVEIIEYRINIINGRKELSSIQKQIGNVIIEGFWDFSQVLYRLKK